MNLQVECNESEVVDSIFANIYLFYIAQCIELVDYYAPRFFSEVASVLPRELCKQVHLCQSANISSQVQGNSCDSCKDTISTILVKLNDPDTKVSNLASQCQSRLLLKNTLCILFKIYSELQNHNKIIKDKKIDCIFNFQ